MYFYKITKDKKIENSIDHIGFKFYVTFWYVM